MSALTQDQQAFRPYALGTTEIIPKLTTAFSASEEFSAVLLIYNPCTDANGRSDVTVRLLHDGPQGRYGRGWPADKGNVKYLLW